MDSIVLQIISGSGVGVTFLYFLYRILEKKVDTTVTKFETMHEQAMDKFGKLTKEISELTKTNAVHNTKLEHGDARFENIEAELLRVRENQHALRDSVHLVKNKMVTQEQVTLLVKELGK